MLIALVSLGLDLLRFKETVFGGNMIENVMEKWFAVVGGNGDIRELLHEDCVFWSPVLFHPQVGAELTAMYLSAAGMVFQGMGEGMRVSLEF